MALLIKMFSYLYKISDLEWVDGAKEALAYAYSKGYDLIVVTNQAEWLVVITKSLMYRFFMTIWLMN